MCGICGIASAEAAPDPAILAEMSATLVHRGPDSDGLFADRHAALAARRLSIIDVEHGSQPIANEDGRITAVHNGEIYNHRSLRERLTRAGHAFRTTCDTEVLVHLYEDEGPDLVHALRGMFAFAVWDARERRLLIARDRFGIKPLYLHQRDGTLHFASELRALLKAPGVGSEVDVEALEAYLAFNSIPGPRSILRGVRKLLPGHVLSWQGGRSDVWEYDRPRPAPQTTLREERPAELADQLLARLRDSVRAHLVSDVEVGVLLSGGIDSTALTALAAQEAGPGVKTFSVGFEERSFDELEKARAVARRYATDHHELVLRPDVEELLPRLAAAFDEPLGDSSALPTFLVAELAANHVKVALSGEGADELFGGYYTYAADLLAPHARHLAALARPAVERLPSSSRKVSLDYKAKRFVRGASLPPLERHHAWREIFSDDARAELLTSRADGFDPLDAYRACFGETADAEPLARLQDVDVRVYLVDDLLVKADRASMAHSLETRVPYLDPAVAGLALSLPRKLRVRGLAKKRLLRRAVRPLLPRRVVVGRKQGFSIPAAAWLRGPLLPFAREVLAPDRVRRHGLLRPEAVTALLDRHASRREDLSRQLWGLLMLTLWLDGVSGR